MQKKIRNRAILFIYYFESHLGETNRIKVVASLGANVERHGFGSLTSNQSIGELVERGGCLGDGGGGKGRGGTGKSREESIGELGHGWIFNLTVGNYLSRVLLHAVEYRMSCRESRESTVASFR